MKETVKFDQLFVGGLRAGFAYVPYTLQSVLNLRLDLIEFSSFRSDSMDFMEYPG